MTDQARARALADEGDELLRSDRRPEALERFTEAVALDPGSALGWAGKGRLLLERGFVREADECLGRARQLMEGDTAAGQLPDGKAGWHVYAALGLQEELQPDGERGLYAPADGVLPTRTELLVRHGRRNLAARALDDALRCFDAALEETPGDGEALAAKVFALARTGRLPEALAAARDADPGRADHALVWHYAAQVHEALGDRAQAAKAYEHFLGFEQPVGRTGEVLAAQASLSRLRMPEPEWVAPSPPAGILSKVFKALSGDAGPARHDPVAKLADEFRTLVEGKQGRLGRTNGTFFSYEAVAAALTPLRTDLAQGAKLTEKGEHFARCAAAYLASIARSNWQRRGFETGYGNADRPLLAGAGRTRSGRRETYVHDFEAEARLLLLPPQRGIAWIANELYKLGDWRVPTPEYVYLYGVVMMQSQYAGGAWPRGPEPGGLEEDFEASKQLLIDDLHADTGIPGDHLGLRALSRWAVFPPYGWQRNAGQSYNMMTLLDQSLGQRPVVANDVGIAYLRTLLTSQSRVIRDLAASTLMVRGLEPETPVEREHYQRVLDGPERTDSVNAMLNHRHSFERMNGGAPAQPDESWVRRVIGGFEALVRDGPRSDASPEEAIQRGEKLLGAGAADDALASYGDALKTWPWEQRLVDGCMRALTHGMTTGAAQKKEQGS